MSADSPVSGFSKLRRILSFPFGLGRRIQALELNATQIRGQHQQLAQQQAQLALDYAQLRRDHDAAVAWLQSTHGEIVSAIGKKIDVEDFDKLWQQQAQLAGDLAQLRRDHDAGVAWLQSTHEEVVSAIGKKIDVEHFDKFTQQQAQLAGDLAQLRRDHDAGVAWLQSNHGEMVSAIGKKIDVEHFDQLTQQQAQLTVDYAQLRRDHDAAVAWLQSTYPEIASAIGNKIEPEQFAQLTQDVFAALHREIGTLRDRLIGLEHTAIPSPPALVPASQEDSRSTGFYLELERRFRGTAAEISARAQPYLELLQTNPAAHSPVLDIGCGRGEWLTLLADQHLPASGIDLNPINGDYCRSRGLDVHTGDALAHLAALPANSLGTVTAFHLVEHLPFSMLLALTDEILRVLKPGGLLIYETPNPENLLVATQSFWLDPTHLRPLPPHLLEFLVLQRGLGQAEVRRLHPGERSPTGDATLQALLSGPRDYAVLARKAN